MSSTLTSTPANSPANSPREHKSLAAHVGIFVFAVVTLALGTSFSPVQAQDDSRVLFKRIAPQFIASLGDPKANSGTGAENWGIWPVDPGPRGVWLKLFPVLRATGGFAPAGWQFDENDWWVDENGLLMDKPDFPLAAGKYLVTGEREVTTMLTVHPADAAGEQRWELAENASLYDVTHLACRSARYTHATEANTCSPANVDRSLFKIAPDDDMPSVEGCDKQDYSVLIVVGVAAES